jgi:hypothetical protein
MQRFTTTRPEIGVSIEKTEMKNVAGKLKGLATPPAPVKLV